MRVVFTMKLQSGAEATASFSVYTKSGKAFRRFRPDTTGREIAGLTLYWKEAAPGRYRMIGELNNGTLDKDKRWCGLVYFESLNVDITSTVPGQPATNTVLIRKGKHCIDQRSTAYMIDAAGASGNQAERDRSYNCFGPQQVPLEPINDWVRDYWDADEVSAMQWSAMNEALLLESYGPYQPYGMPGGNEAGGDGVAFYDPIELIPSSSCIMACWSIARRIAHKTDTLALDHAGEPLLPRDLADENGYLPFDMHANTNDDGRIPQFTDITEGPWNYGECPYWNDLQKFKQNDPEHYSRALTGLQGLVSHLMPDEPLSMWARDTLYRRAAHLRMWKPDIPGKGATLPDIIASGVPGGMGP